MFTFSHFVFFSNWLIGIEQTDGIELEAATGNSKMYPYVILALSFSLCILSFSFIFPYYLLVHLSNTGIVQISQLFMRWLALMPGADHSNVINPPGLTVMRILGGKYRVTAAHRVIWQ